jgi:O-methyltransferase
MIRNVRSALARLTGFTAKNARHGVPDDLAPEVKEIVRRVRSRTMTSPERIAALCNAVEHVVRHELPGDFVECGVWKGGSVLAMILTLQKLGKADRDIWLFDTFDGMTAPTAHDRDLDGTSAEELLANSQPDTSVIWAKSGIDQVKAAVTATGYPSDRIHFVKGPVESTIPAHGPGRIAILRLDTDWYESTRHELEHLYPRLAAGGVLIIDDYGHWQGARKAVDEYFASGQRRIFLHRVDYTGRIGIKEPGTSA